MTTDRTILSRVLPFGLFMAFIGLEEIARPFAKHYNIFDNDVFTFIYPFKAFSVLLIILLLWKNYDEIRIKDLLNFRHTLVSLLVGMIVFFLWINMNWKFGTFGEPKGYDPTAISPKNLQIILICIRIFGAAAIVPIMEELFWRSFLIRYVVDNNFRDVPIGHFTWMSFIISTVMFGLEHNFFIAGMMAGCFYNILLYYTKSLSQCILAHGLTNLLLGLYVLQTGKWYFW